MRIALLILLCAGALNAQPDFGLLRGQKVFSNGATDKMEETGTSPFNLSYTIRNDGTGDLLLTGSPLVEVTEQDNCSVGLIQAPAPTVAQGGGTTDFILQVSPIAATKFKFQFAIASNDPGSNPFTLKFEGNTTRPDDDPARSSGSDDCSARQGGSSGWAVPLGCALLAALRRRRGLRQALN
jgi:hypothetical protein